MALLVRVEVAREQRRRAELLVAESTQAEAAVVAECATREHLEAREQRQTLFLMRIRQIISCRMLPANLG